MIQTHNTSQNLQDSYHALLLGYAAGTLDEAQDLIVSTHIAMSQAGRQAVSAYEAVGGHLMETECDPVQMCDDALDHVLARIEAPWAEKKTAATADDFTFHNDITLPDGLYQKVRTHCRDQRWGMLYPGLKTMEMPMECKRSKVRFLDAAPALKTPHHTHGGIEITLVLSGAFTDETGHYRRGDLVVTDETLHHTPTACPEAGCVCMVVSSAPIKLTGLASLLNPFVRI